MDKDTTLLTCFLAKNGDTKNQIVIRSSSITVYYKGNREDFGYGELKGIRVGRKKLIIPLVLGGIGTSFSMLALMLGWYHYELNLLAVFLFFMWMYYGFSGSDALAVDVKNHQHLYLLRSNRKVVQEVINFLTERMWKISSNIESQLFHIADREQWESQLGRYYYEPQSFETDGFVHLSERQDLQETVKLHMSPGAQLILVCINPKWLTEPMKYDFVSGRGKEMPHLYGALNKSSILWAAELSTEDLLAGYLETYE